METWKYDSPLGGDNCKTTHLNSKVWKGKKVQAALAFAVSLWIGGSVAEAASVSYIYLDINNNDQLHNDVSEQVTPVQNGKKLTITGVNLPGNLLVFGGYANSNNDAIGYTLELNNVTGDGIGRIYGGDN